jgi:hypothetical protein
VVGWPTSFWERRHLAGLVWAGGLLDVGNLAPQAQQGYLAMPRALRVVHLDHDPGALLGLPDIDDEEWYGQAPTGLDCQVENRLLPTSFAASATMTISAVVCEGSSRSGAVMKTIMSQVRSLGVPLAKGRR